jgi:hypothetical protein
MASIVSVTIVMLSIVGYALAWSGFLRLPLALTLISACCAIACVLYAGALAGVLYPIQVVVLWGGVAALAVWIVRTPRPELRRQLTAPATIAFVVGCVVLFVVTRGLVLTDWDDFANWGAISKVLLLTDRLPREPESLLFLYYPPGDALFQYFVAKPLAYSEGNMLFGHAVFQWAAIMPILATVRWRDCVLGVSLLAISIVAGYLLGSPYANWTTLMVDVEIALLFAAVLTIYLLGGGGVRAILCTVPVVADLPISMFELRPRRVNDYGFSFGPKRFDGDIWSSDLTPELLRSRLQGYDFVFLGQADDVFWNRYASLFASGAREAATPLFRVDKSNGEELLSPVLTVAQTAK